MLARTSTMRTIEREAIWTAWRQPANGADLRFGAGPVALAWCQLPHRRRTRRQACSSVTSGSRLRLALWDTAKLCPETGRGGGSRVGSKSRRGFRWTVRDRAVGGRPDRLELCHTIHKRTGYWYAVSPTVAGVQRTRNRFQDLGWLEWNDSPRGFSTCMWRVHGHSPRAAHGASWRGAGSGPSTNPRLGS